MKEIINEKELKAFTNELGEELRRIRRIQSISIQKLAEYTGLHRNTISDAERGRKDLSLVSMARIMAALGSDKFDVGESTFKFEISEMNSYPVLFDIISTPANRIVYMTSQAVHSQRSKLGITIEYLAELTGIHKNSIWNIEKALVNPSIFNLFKIHKNLQVKTLKGCSSGLFILK